MEDNFDGSTTSFLQAFIGFPKKLLKDEGSQLVKGCESMQFDFQNIKHQLFKKMEVVFDTILVGGHNVHGGVER